MEKETFWKHVFPCYFYFFVRLSEILSQSCQYLSSSYRASLIYVNHPLF